MHKSLKFSIFIFIGLFLIFSFNKKVLAQSTASNSANTKVMIEIFSRPDCTHCQDQKAFLEKLMSQRDDFFINDYNIYLDENKQLYTEVTEAKKLAKVTPITLIGKTIIQGFDRDETTGEQMIQLIESNKGKANIGFKKSLDLNEQSQIHQVEGGSCDDNCEIAPVQLVHVPFFGNVNIQILSLPILSVILGFVDGFNPCAMWVLITFLVVLAQVKDRKKMWQFAGTFIIAESIMYALILTVWYNAWDFVGMDKYVNPIIGIVSIGGALFFLREFWNNKGDEVECKVTNSDQKIKITHKIKDLISKKFTIITFLGIVALAFSVNIIEFACSIGIPQAFTKILELNQLSLWQMIIYVTIYIFFYMIDDFIVFGIALYSFDKIGVTAKYAKWANLIGGLLMLFLGWMLLFKPELLTTIF